MSLLYTQAEIEAISANLGCCAADIANKALTSEIFGEKDAVCFRAKSIFLNKVSCILSNYTVPGTPLTPGFVSTAILDFSSDTTTYNDSLVANIVINGKIIATMPITLLTSTNDLIDKLVIAKIMLVMFI